MSRDSVLGTFMIATILCVACSLLVSGAAEGLKEKQEENRAIDKKKNVLVAAGLAEATATREEVNQIYEDRIREEMVDLNAGQPVSEGQIPDGYDAEKAAKGPEHVEVQPPDALMGIRRRAPMIPVYKIVEGEQLQGFVFPVEGKGLWSTLYGFLAIEADGETVRGITFYKDGETPGLGGEINNPNWQGKWPGKKVYNPDGEVTLGVVKGSASGPNADYQIDGLSGATITSNGVDGIISYWLGPNGFGPYLKSQSSEG